MKNGIRMAALLLAALACGGLLLGGCAAQKPKPGEPFSCVAPGKLEKQIVPEASLQEFSCFFKKWKGSETLHFKVAVKNVSTGPRRFRVNIFLDNGKAVGGLIPRKTKKGLVKPGQTASFIYPVKGMDEKPGAVTLIIRTIS
ncbi:MAG: hypothetical protein JRH05_11335 [Deltaproteobacteria bacterium]|nr:hypothetical protein [Deltaproteobacteria bacterium]